MITSKDKIADLIKRYPYIKKALMRRNKVFKHLNNPALFNTVGKFARISDVANVSGEKLDDLLVFINGLIVEKEDQLDELKGESNPLN